MAGHLFCLSFRPIGREMLQIMPSTSATKAASCCLNVRLTQSSSFSPLFHRQQGREFECISISDSDSADCQWMLTREAGSLPSDAMVFKKKKVVLIMSRVHPAETAGSFLCQGMSFTSWTQRSPDTSPLPGVLADSSHWSISPASNTSSMHSLPLINYPLLPQHKVPAIAGMHD